MRWQSRPKPMRRTVVIAVVVVACAAVFSGAAAATNGKVLVVEDTVVGNAIDNPAPRGAGEGLPPSVSVEAHAAILDGRGVTAVTAAELAGMSTAAVAEYDAVVLGDRKCATNANILAPLLGTAASPTKWGPAITGNVIVLGTDPVKSFFEGTNGSANMATLYVIRGGISFAAAGTGTGAYIDLSCYYKDAAPATHVDVLDPFGSFSVRGAPCNNNAHVVATHPSFDALGWYDVHFSDWWVCSARETFGSFPASFKPIVDLTDAPGSNTGVPYIIARGSGIVPLPGTTPNSAPVANDDAYSTGQGVALDVGAADGVLTNDSDVDLNPLTAVEVAGPSNGSLTLSPDGSLVYTPNAHFAGTETFTYKANDGALDSNIATVTITVNDTEPPAITCPSDVTTPVDAGQSSAVVNYTVNATDNAAGVVTISSNPASGTAFPVGPTTVQATATDAAGNPSTCSFTVTVDKRSTSTSIDSGVNPSTVGQSVTLTATVVSGADPVTGGTVRFREGAVDLSGDLPLGGDGKAMLAISSLGAGPHTITVDYSGTGGYEGSSAQLTQVVALRPTALVYTGPATATTGATALTAKLTDVSLGTGLAGVDVRFAVDGGAPQSAVTNAAGVASFTPSVPLGLGPHSIAIRFAGDGTYSGSIAAGTITIANPTGGGSVSCDDVKPSTGGSIDMNVKLQVGRVLKGSFVYIGKSTRLESKWMTALTIARDGKSAWIFGVARDGRIFVVYVERGKPLILKLWINGVLQTGTGAIRSGSIKIKTS